MLRAYSFLQVKSIDEDERVIEGIASTPTTDRSGDIVEPLGAKFKLPLPALLFHDSRNPVAVVEWAKPNKDGIPYRMRFPQAGLLSKVDEAWKMVKAGLIRAVSIGFSEIETAVLKTGGMHFLEWEWLELSLVSVPANAEATITTIKSLDETQLAASGSALGEVKPLTKSPGASGTTFPKGKIMQTYAEQIQNWVNKRAASAAAQDAIMKKASEDGTALDAEETEQYDQLDAEVEQIDGHIVRLKKLEERAKKEAVKVPADPAASADEKKTARTTDIISVRQNVEPGVKMARYAMALYRGEGNAEKALNIVLRNKAWMDTTPEVATVLKTAVAAGDTTTAGWASELVYAQNLSNEFIEFLRPMTIIGRLKGFRNVPFNIRVPSQTGGGTGNWIGQGKPIPMSKLTTGSLTLGITKAAGLMAIDDELARSSAPSAEIMVRNDLAKTVQQLLDLSFIDPNQGGVTNVQPASVTYNVTPVSPTGTNFAAITTDIKNLFSTAIAANLDLSGFVWIMSPTTALSLSFMQTSLGNPQFPTISITGGSWMGLPVIVTNAANIAGSPDYANMIILINPSEILLADDGQVAISISNEASIEMLDNPTNSSTATVTATSMVSMFQTNTMAIKAVRYINWVKTRSQAVALIRTAAYA